MGYEGPGGGFQSDSVNYGRPDKRSPGSATLTLRARRKSRKI